MARNLKAAAKPLPPRDKKGRFTKRSGTMAQLPIGWRPPARIVYHLTREPENCLEVPVVWHVTVAE
jgi:hypothetical protein